MLSTQVTYPNHRCSFKSPRCRHFWSHCQFCLSFSLRWHFCVACKPIRIQFIRIWCCASSSPKCCSSLDSNRDAIWSIRNFRAKLSRFVCTMHGWLRSHGPQWTVCICIECSLRWETWTTDRWDSISQSDTEHRLLLLDCRLEWGHMSTEIICCKYSLFSVFFLNFHTHFRRNRF